MSDALDVLIRHHLDNLEREETKLLSWGVVDGGFTHDEIEDLADSAIQDSEVEISTESLLREMLERKLLFSFRVGGSELYRTRMGEAVRLFARLRQMFPARPWQLAPTLVADYRFDRRARRYPERHRKRGDVLAAITAEVRLNPLRRRALEALLRIDEPHPLELADFQFYALRRILRDLEARVSRGVIVGAGTGTGKTLAFYLPALSHIAGLIERNANWTKAIAIYPRNELLKDQFSETYTEARRLDTLLCAESGRKLTIGAFFGSTPRDASEVKRYSSWGDPVPGGYQCPFLRCPRCEGMLIWRTADIDQNVEELHCTTRGCDQIVRADEVILTRNRMSRTPPDVLFTTTEMLNRQMGNSQYGHIFGLGPRTRSPQIMLLDEVHTYSGVSGAQVALLLRRWQHAIGTKVQFTGLSATLRAAAEFFSQLVGLKSGAVEEVSPNDGELDPEPESVEYVLALRGDPVAGTSLLSTSIQAAMLLRRILDPPNSEPSRGLYGKRVFVFTDDLDVTNRLYNNLQDAEGLNSWNRPQPGAVPLAALRSGTAPDNAARLLAGQSWQACEDIGHPPGLRRPLSLGRTSSQDTGVDRGSDVIVATAALEVGYNDPDVGAVMQHKAPRDWAAFLQRKGRAGRRRAMRPWTVVVLSDYGRDRLAYQAYDQFFDPELPFRSLPIGNRYILRMQAAFTFMDWLASRMPASLPEGSVWQDLSSSPKNNNWWEENLRRRQEWITHVLTQLIEGVEEACSSLEMYVLEALAITNDEKEAIFWDPPRPIYTAVVPTLLRRIESGWHRVKAEPDEPDTDRQVNDHPLPDFVPRQLFGDLNLPEVEIITPPQLRGQDPKRNALPIVQSLRTLAPGRVTRRFGFEHAFANHWVAPPDLQRANQTLAIEDYCPDSEEAGVFQIWDGVVRDVRCVRPWTITAVLPPQAVLPTSNAQLVWRSQLSPAREDDRLCFDPPRGTVWSSLLKEICFYTHTQHTHVQVRRFAVASEASLSFRDGSQLETTIRFVERGSGNPAAIGYSQEADGIVFRFRIPEDLGLSPEHPNKRKVRSFRTAYFRERFQSDATVAQYANYFQRDWLVQIYLSALVNRAVRDASTIEEAHSALHGAHSAAELEHVLDVIFQSLDLPGGGQGRQRMHGDLSTLCRTAQVTAALGEAARVLWLPPDDGYRHWATLRFKATLGGALLEACQQSCPQMEASDLYLDLDAGPRPPDAPQLAEGLEEIWITEATIGGGGVIEEVLRAYTADPRYFFRLAESALAASDFEVVDRELTRILALVAGDADLQAALRAVRSADGHSALELAAKRLRSLLATRGVTVNHSLISALHARVIRPGSSVASDAMLLEFVRHWHGEEERLDVEMDARVFAFVASEVSEFQARLAALGSFPLQDPFWRFQAIYGLLWPRGFQVRSEGLAFYNPFAESPPPDREILLDLLRAGERTVHLGANWKDEVERALASRGAVRMAAPHTERTALKEALLLLAAEPLEVGFLHLYPHVTSITEDQEEIVVTLDLREVLP